MPPLPKPEGQRARRNATVAMTRLPAEGRKGKAPAFPLPEQTRRERVLWSRLWKAPQAVMWERMDCVAVVARYVRVLTEAEGHHASGVSLAEARRLEDVLGLSPVAMLRLRWTVGEVEQSGKQPAGVLDIRQRLAAAE